MTVYITGDVHGDYDFAKFNDFQVTHKNLSKDDYVIVCGDFGLIWNWQGQDKRETRLLAAYAAMPYTILFVDGNHECHPRLLDFPTVEFCGGKAHKISDNIYHLMRGEIYTIENKTYFCMGGAPSHDKQWRIEGESWWAEEVPGLSERQYALDNLAAHDNKVNYIITHDAPSSIAAHLIFRSYDGSRVITGWGDWLEELDTKIEFDHWYFGHYHVDTDLENLYTCLYWGFVEAGDNLYKGNSYWSLNPIM